VADQLTVPRALVPRRVHGSVPALSRHLRRALAIAALLSPGVVVLSAIPASATTCVAGQASNYFAGYKRNVPTGNAGFAGVSSSVTIEPGGLCSGQGGQNNFYSGWAMITPQQDSGYAQSGFNDDDQENKFTDFASSSSTYTAAPVVYGPVVSANQVHRYWVEFANNILYMNVDGQVLARSTFDPQTVWPAPFRPRIFRRGWVSPK
jgi:hypothetical protein